MTNWEEAAASRLVSSTEVAPTADCRGLSVCKEGDAAWAIVVTAGVQD